MRRTPFLTIALSMLVWTGCGSAASEDVDAASHVMNDAAWADADGDPDAVSPDGALPDGALPDGALPDGALPDGALDDGGLQDGAGLDGTHGDGGIPTIADLCWDACTYVDICGGGTGNPDPACLTGPGSCGEDLLDCSVSQLLDVQACNDAYSVNADCTAFINCLTMVACIN